MCSAPHLFCTRIALAIRVREALLDGIDSNFDGPVLVR